MKLDKDKNLKDYFAAFEDILSQLYAAGGQVSEQDKIAYLTGGLPKEYETTLDTIEATEGNLTLGAIKGKLLEKEEKLKDGTADTSQKALFSSAQPDEVQVNNAKNVRGSFRGRHGRGRGYRGNFNSNRGRGHFNNNRGRGNQRGNNRGYYRGNNRGNYRGNNRGYHNNQKDRKCDFCGRFGHQMDTCIYAKRDKERRSMPDNNDKQETGYLARHRDFGSEDPNFTPHFGFMAGNQQSHLIGNIEFVVD